MSFQLKDAFSNIIVTITSLTGMNRSDFATLEQVAPELTDWKDDLVKVFYDTLFADTKTASLFLPGERANREKTFGDWYLQVLSVQDERRFWHAQARIAFAHIRRRVNNELMVAMASKVLNCFMEKAITTFGPQQGIAVTQAFGRILHSVVGVTVAFHDLILLEVTNPSQDIIDNLIELSLEEVQQSFID